MRVCIVAEGCYPFVVGGVSSWVHSLIQLFPETEFVILAIAANRSQRGKYAYELPKNVSAVYELYLDDVDWSGSKKLHRKRLKKEQYQALRSLILDQDIEWDVLFDLFQKENVSLNALLMGEDFLNAVRDCYNLKYSQISCGRCVRFICRCFSPCRRKYRVPICTTVLQPVMRGFLVPWQNTSTAAVS